MLSKKQEPIGKFLRKKQVRGGSCKTPLFVLYYYYVKYCQWSKLHIVSPIEFGRQLSKLFIKGKSGRFCYYLTNIEAPDSKKRRKIRLWYRNRVWARMRNDKKGKQKISKPS